MKKILSLLLAALMTLALLACSKPAAQGQTSEATSATDVPKTEQPSNTEAVSEQPGKEPESEPSEPELPIYPIETLVIGTTAAIEKAVIGEYNYEMLASGVTHPPLVWQDTEGTFHPLAASWSTEDATTWTYTVEDGMKWENGTPVTAEDILFTLQYEDANGSANLTDQTDPEGKTTKAKYVSYKLSDDGRSISLTLASPNVRELGNMTSFRIVPKQMLEGKEEPTDAELRFGYGPYVFSDFNKDAGTITFVASETYPTRPQVKEIVYRLFNNDDTMFMALQQGDIDMVWVYSTGVAASYQDVLAASEAVQLISVTAQNAPAVLAFNNAKGPFADENLRHAVANILNYETIRNKVGSALAEIPNAGFVPVPTIGYTPTEKMKMDFAEAEKYLNAAGYAKNDEGKFVNENGEFFAFTLTFRSDRANLVSCAELIKTAVEDFGGEVTLEGLDSNSFNAKTSNKFSENNITMEAALFGYTSAGMGMGNGLATIYVDGTHAVQGGAQVYDEEFQSALGAMSNAKNLDEYTAAAADMQRFYAKHLPVIALYWDALTYGASSKLGNIVVDNVFGLNNVQNWLSINYK